MSLSTRDTSPQRGVWERLGGAAGLIGGFLVIGTAIGTEAEDWRLATAISASIVLTVIAGEISASYRQQRDYLRRTLVKVVQSHDQLDPDNPLAFVPQDVLDDARKAGEPRG